MTTLKDLIDFAERNNLPLDTKIIVTSSNIELNYDMVDIKPSIDLVEKVERVYRDMFDGTIYHKEVYVSDSDGEKIIYLGDE